MAERACHGFGSITQAGLTQAPSVLPTPVALLIPALPQSGPEQCDPIAPGASHGDRVGVRPRSEEHTSELQSLMRISYAVFCLKKKKQQHHRTQHDTDNDGQAKSASNKTTQSNQ